MHTQFSCSIIINKKFEYPHFKIKSLLFYFTFINAAMFPHLSNNFDECNILTQILNDDDENWNHILNYPLRAIIRGLVLLYTLIIIIIIMFD